MAEHAPGPWRVDSVKLGTVRSVESRETVAIVSGNIDGSPHATASLIAAAPDMYEILCLIQNHLDKPNTYLSGGTWFVEHAKSLNDMIEFATRDIY